ncbi:hypothetical protein Hanom_Chr10g00939621 [Helianthus anomalus]
MEDQLSFISPRRTLSYSRNRGATFSVFEADNKASGVGVSGEHGLNPSEVYGFVGAISTVVATGILPSITLLFFIMFFFSSSSVDVAILTYLLKDYLFV